MRRVVLLICIMLAAPAAWAGKLAGVALPDSITVDGKPLVLNGMGIRKATIFKVKVYVAGLYLETRSHSADDIVRSEQIKRLDLVLVRDVDRDDIVDVWRKGFKNNGADMAKLKARLDQLIGWMSDLKERDTLTFLYQPGRGTTVVLRGQAKGTIAGADFAAAMFSVWFGRDPADDDLKESLVGK